MKTREVSKRISILKNHNSSNNLTPDPGNFCQTALISHMPKHGPSYSGILRAEKKEEMQCQGWRGLLYLLHRPGKSKATWMSFNLGENNFLNTRICSFFSSHKKGQLISSAFQPFSFAPIASPFRIKSLASQYLQYSM